MSTIGWVEDLQSADHTLDQPEHSILAEGRWLVEISGYPQNFCSHLNKVTNIIKSVVIKKGKLQKEQQTSLHLFRLCRRGKEDFFQERMKVYAKRLSPFEVQQPHGMSLVGDNMFRYSFIA